jgi:TctA family transporter
MDISAALDNLALGFAVALAGSNLFYCFLGVSVGMLVGVLPGIGAMAALSMLFPLTFHLGATEALIMLAGIWYGTSYGGSTAAILLNVPGTPSSAVTSLDGYRLSRQGKAGVALFIAAGASFVGGSLGIIMLMLFAPLIAAYAIEFGSTEYFALMVLGLIAASTITNGSTIKALVMVAFGILLGTVGTDLTSGTLRFDFGVTPLADGVNLVALAMGLFGIAEVISSVRLVESTVVDGKSVTLRSMIPSRDDLRRSMMPTLRGSGIGAFFGALPGTGSAIAAFIAYAVEKRTARDPSRIGNGAIEGVASPEAANNAADQTAFIPTLLLGIPGSAAMAIMIAALMIQGITPGPNIMNLQPGLFWGLIISFWIGNLILLIMAGPLVSIWIRLLMIPFRWLYPGILLFVCIGVYSVNNSSIDVWMVVVLGALGYLFRIADLPAAPLLLGFVLGPMMEEHFRRALIFSRGDFSIFVTRPISGTIIALTIALVVWSIWKWLRADAGDHIQQPG